MEKPEDWNSNSRDPIIAIADCGARANQEIQLSPNVASAPPVALARTYPELSTGSDESRLPHAGH